MSGSPTQAEVQTQWRYVVDLLEDMRAYADGTVAGSGNQLDLLLQSLEGEYTPVGLANAAARFRSTLSSLIEPSRVQEFLAPIFAEYSRLITGGGGYASMGDIMRSLYEWFVANSLTVESRNITYDSSATLGAGNVGNGGISRLTVDENAFSLEACTVEKKIFRCRRDQNSGAQEHAEEFEVIGTTASQDALLRSSFGSGDRGKVVLRSRHAGSQAGGSLLRNSSFSTYSSTASPKFSGWTETTGGSNLAQDTTNYYRSYPGATVDASLRINGGGGTVTIKQPLEDMAQTRLDPNQPYFLRVMVNPTVGTASGGTLTIKMGSHSVSLAVSSMTSGWQELVITANTNCWFRNFNENPLDVEITWTSSTSGYLLIDDVIFCPWDLVDGTYWIVRGNAATNTPWLVDDTLEFTDTGGAPATAKIQWWLWVAGLGYLPSTTGTPTFTEP